MVFSKGPSQPVFVAGRFVYDFVTGYVRMESWNSPDPNPGINGVTIWDMRDKNPIVTTIDSNVQCWVQTLSDSVSAPRAGDFKSYTYGQLAYFNRALSEAWVEPGGGYLYVDVFSRAIVGMGNNTPGDDGSVYYYNIQDWTEKAPDGTVFLLPNTIKCQNITSAPLSNVPRIHPLISFPIKTITCTACHIGISKILGKVGCGSAGAAACVAFPPAVPFCSALATAACSAGGKLASDKACKIIHAC